MSMRDEKQIVIWHVGGQGDYGPIRSIITTMFPNISLVVFEARNDTNDIEQSKKFIENGVQTTIIFKGVDGKIGKNTEFYVNKFPLSSSLLPSSPLTINENCEYPHCHSWGQNTELDHKIMVDTVTLDHILTMGTVPPPDIISIDAQGADFFILQGANKVLDTALCVVTEIEFFEIYDGQGLFDDQMKLLSEKGYRLHDIVNQQKWHPGPAAGKGFLTVGEAVFMRYALDMPCINGKRGYVPLGSLTDWQLIRLAGIAISFNSFGYAYTLGTTLRQRNPSLYKACRSIKKYYLINQLVDMIDAGNEMYSRDPLFWIGKLDLIHENVK